MGLLFRETAVPYRTNSGTKPDDGIPVCMTVFLQVKRTSNHSTAADGLRRDP